MALVAYGSSDDSDNNTDQEDDGQVSGGILEINAPILKRAPMTNNPTESCVSLPSTRTSSVLEDEDQEVEDDDLASPRPSLFQNIPLPKPRSQTTFEKETEDDYMGNPKSRFSVPLTEADDEVEIGLHRPLPLRTKLSLKLPAPKGSGDKEINLGNEVPSELETEGGTIASSLTAVPKKKQGKSVKITVPAISTFDSDEEEETPVKKKIKQSSGLSGLFAILPPPKNSVNKVMNRSLIPHTLSKKPASSSTSNNSSRALPQKKEHLPVPAKFKPNDSEDEEDDDDVGEDGAVNFFSLSDKSDTASVFPADIKTLAEASTVVTGPNQTQDYTSAINQETSWFPTPSGYSPSPNTEVFGSDSEAGASAAYDYSEQNMGDEMPDGNMEQIPDCLPACLPQSALRELQGKKRGRGQEDINIIDVSQDDQLPKSEEWLTKGLTEERASYSHRKKTHMPTSQQRRKHQITYLAFQAKERELELKNQWAQNRLTKRQTQSKYGF